MARRDDIDRHRRRVLGDRSDADREFHGNVAFTESEREAFIDHAMALEQRAREADEDRRESCQRIRDTAIGGTIAGSVGGAVAALLIAAGKWLLPLLLMWFGTR